MSDFDTPINRRGTSSMKWDRYPESALPLWVADTDFRSPPALIQALRERVEHGVFGYTDPPEELLEVVRERLWRLYRWPVDAEWIIWLPGLVTGINAACRAAGERGSQVLSMTPIYPPFLSAPDKAERGLITTPMVLDGELWVIDYAALESAITPDTSLLLLCNPQNPLGRVFRREELSRLASICARHDLLICSDEIHCDLLLEPGLEHLPTATLDTEVAERCITLMAPSKTFNIAGLGCSFAVISNPRLRHRFARVISGIVPSVNLLGFTAALSAYRDCDDWHREQLAYLRANRDLAYRHLGQMPGLKTWLGEATYLAWIDARELVRPGREDPAGFFAAQGVILSNGRDFGTPGFVRLNFGCTRDTLCQALERMAKGLASLT